MPRLLLLIFLLLTGIAAPRLASAAPRQVVLVEHFTNVGSDSCSLRNPGIYTALAAMGRDTALLVSYHTWWPDDDPFNAWNPSDIAGRVNLYDVGTLVDLFVDYTRQPAPSNVNALRSGIRARYNEPAPCSIALSAATAGASALHVSVSMTADEAMTSPDLRLFVALITNDVTYTTPPGDNGELYFPGVFRDIAPHPSSGQSFVLQDGETFDYDALLNRSAAWNLEDLSAVAFVQDTRTREILQTAWTAITTTPGSLTLTSPNGGEIWYTGTNQNITWTSTGLPENVRVQINRQYPAGLWETLLPATANDGSHTWPVTGPGTTTARIRVTGTEQLSTGDSSNINFSIAGLTVTAPGAGDTFFVGEPDTIFWNRTVLTENVRIEVNRNYPAGPWTPVTTSTANDGVHVWTPTGTATANARVRILGIVHTTTGDTSDTDFVIATRTIAVTSPNTAVSWAVSDLRLILWNTANVPAPVRIEVNHQFPNGPWTVVEDSTLNDGRYMWIVPPPATTRARVRVTSRHNGAIGDTSDTNFSIFVPDVRPVLIHDPLADRAPGSGAVTAIAHDPRTVASIGSVKMFYRLQGGGAFDSLAMLPTGNLNEYSAALTALATPGTYEYYLRALDNANMAATAPADAPAQLHRFDVDNACSSVLSYDDGSAERFHWVQNASGENFLWALRFGPVDTPYVLCGARVAVSRMLPDALHTPFYVAVYAADGNLPGALLHSTTSGSVGNVPGGLQPGVHWADILLREAPGDPLVIRNTEFFVAVGNREGGQIEAFGHDTGSTNHHRSVFYDQCEARWFSEDDVTGSPNARPGNRMIRALGYSLTPPAITIARSGGDVILRWAATGAPVYRIYSSTSASGPFATLVGTCTEPTFRHASALASNERCFYRVVSADR